MNPISMLRQVRHEIAEIHASVHQCGTLQSGANADRSANRLFIANLYLRGYGIEVGALHNPLPVPREASVRYVDRMSATDLRQQYPELGKQRLVEPDVIDDGEKLATFPDASVDFIIANHFIEHCGDPIGTLSHFLRVVRRGGVIFLAAPDKRYTFDRERPLTSLEHLVIDHAEGPDQSRRQHFEEFAKAMESLRNDPVYADTINDLCNADFLERTNYSIHYHVWDHSSFLAFLLSIRERFELDYDIDFALRNGDESIAILKRL